MGGPERPGGPAEFSGRQLEQLRDVVRDAIREEVMARLSDEAGCAERGGRGGRFYLSQLAGAGPRAAPAPNGDGSSRGKVADEPVAADDVEDDRLAGSAESPRSPCRASSSLAHQCRGEDSHSVGHHHRGGSAMSRRGETAHSMLNEKRHFGSSISLEELIDGVPLWRRELQIRIHGIVHSTLFDSFMGVVILASCACMGIEVQLKFDGHNVGEWLQSSMPWMDSLFLILFIAEAGLRVAADGPPVLSNPWFRFDVALVAIGATVSWIVVPVVNALGIQDLPIVSQILTLRVLRLLRTVRAFRTMDMFSEMCRLCSGLLRSARTMLSVCLLVLIAIFTFSVLGADLIYKSEKLRADEVTLQIVEKNFSSLSLFMLTLMQFTNADSLASIYFPMCTVQPLLGLYFIALWVVITVALMNLVTAVIVDNALALGREEAEVKEAHDRKILQRNLPLLEELFDKMDKDGSGSVTHDEIKVLHAKGQLRFPAEVQKIIDADHLVNMFEFMDKDKSGEIDKEEFIDGVVCLALNHMSIETLQILQILKDLQKALCPAPSEIHSPTSFSVEDDAFQAVS